MSTSASPLSSPPATPTCIEVLHSFYVLPDQPMEGWSIGGLPVFDAIVCYQEGAPVVPRGTLPTTVPWESAVGAGTPESGVVCATRYGYVLLLVSRCAHHIPPPEDAKDPYKRFALIE